MRGRTDPRIMSRMRCRRCWDPSLRRTNYASGFGMTTEALGATGYSALQVSLRLWRIQVTRIGVQVFVSGLGESWTVALPARRRWQARRATLLEFFWPVPWDDMASV